MVPLEQLMNTSANIAQTIKDGHKKKKLYYFYYFWRASFTNGRIELDSIFMKIWGQYLSPIGDRYHRNPSRTAQKNKA